MHNFFDKEKVVLHYEKLQLFLRLGLKFKKIRGIYNLINQNGSNNIMNLTHRKDQKQKKDRKALCRLMNNAIYGKKMEHLRKRINVKL